MSTTPIRNLRSNSQAPPIWPIVTPANMANPAPAIANEIWTENPTQEDFNPGTSTGQKTFDRLSKGHPEGKLYGLSIKEATEFNVYLKARSPSFGTCINHIPCEWNATGQPTRHVNIVEQYQSVELEVLQRAAHKRYANELQVGNPIPALPWNARTLDPANDPTDRVTFFDRVRSAVIIEFLNNSLEPNALAAIALEKEKFTFTDASGNEKQDGPTKLYLYLKKLDPSTAINIENHRRLIETCRLQKFDMNVTDMVVFIESHFKTIIDNGGEYNEKTYIRHIFDALLSGPNAKFNTHFEMIKTDVQSGMGFHSNITAKKLLTAAQTLFNNLESTDEWTKVDPKEARLLALQTELTQVKTNYAALATLQSQGQGNKPKTGGNSGNNTEKINGVDKWRTIKKGDTIEVDGVTWHWCGEHKSPHWDGLYYRDHTPATHAQWKIGREALKAKTKKDKSLSNQKPQNTSGAKKDLTISSKLRTALASNLCISEDDIKRIEQSLESEN